MHTTLTSNLQRGRIFVLALTFLAAAGLRAQNTPAITGTKVQSPGFVNIYGSGFGTTTGTVVVGSGPATVTYWSDTEVQFSAYTDQTATYPVSVTTSTGAIANFVVSLVSATVSSAAADRDGSATVNSVSINGGNNQAHVSPGATFTVEFNYSAVCSGSACPIAIQLGLDVSTPQTCFYAEVKNGSKTLTMKAPAAPGLHYILFDRNQNYCQAIWDYGIPPLSQSLGSIAVY